MANDEKNSTSGPLPPYTAFQSIKTLSRDLKEHGIPTRIDRSVMTNFSGAVGNQILTALKFLKLTDDENKPTEKMRALVASYDTEDWPAHVASTIREAYAPLFKLDLDSASPAQFMEHFRKTYPSKDEVLRKCVTFFLN